MNKSQKMKKAVSKARRQNAVQWFKKVITWPWRAIKWTWHFICNVCNVVWNWLKNINIVGMINLTLLVAIIVLFLSLIADFVNCNKCDKSTRLNNTNDIALAQQKASSNRRVVQRKYNTTLPVKIDKQTNIKPKIRTIGVKKPKIIRELSLPAKELPKQKLYGDVIVDITPASPILSNGVRIDGNLFIQNIRKYTIPCGAKINGNLFVRNVDKLSFCGEFTVNGNVYVNRQSSFGPIPRNAKIRGQIIL